MLQGSRRIHSHQVGWPRLDRCPDGPHEGLGDPVFYGKDFLSPSSHGCHRKQYLEGEVRLWKKRLLSWQSSAVAGVPGLLSGIEIALRSGCACALKRLHLFFCRAYGAADCSGAAAPASAGAASPPQKFVHSNYKKRSFKKIELNMSHTNITGVQEFWNATPC